LGIFKSLTECGNGTRPRNFFSWEYINRILFVVCLVYGEDAVFLRVLGFSLLEDDQDKGFIRSHQNLQKLKIKTFSGSYTHTGNYACCFRPEIELLASLLVILKEICNIIPRRILIRQNIFCNKEREKTD
jgi:hypothetical protein